MEQHRRARRIGIFVVLCAVVFRLLEAGIPQKVWSLLIQPQTVKFLIYLETGRTAIVRSSDSPVFAFLPESSAPVLAVQEEPTETIPVFSAETPLPEIAYACKVKPAIRELMTQPLRLSLAGEAPTVLIYHTHATESYTKTGQSYEETADYRTLNTDYNMLSIGARIAEILEEAGIHVLHDETLHDYPSYTSAYTHSRKAVREYLKEYPSLQLVLDIHRDAVEVKGRQLRTAAEVHGQASAQLMLVVGTGVNNGVNEYWEQNLSLALKLHALLEAENPGFMRPVSLRGQRFNQDLLPNSLLVEVGAAGNSHAEAMLAAEELAGAIVKLKDGSG